MEERIRSRAEELTKLSHASLARRCAEMESFLDRCGEERDVLRELLVSAEGYALANGAPMPFVRMYVEGSPLTDVILRAGCYPRDASREHPGPLALNRPPE